MPSITKRKNDDGTVGYLAQINVKGFKRTGRTFTTRKAAQSWAEETESMLRKQRERGSARSDLASLTVGDLILQFLADPETTRLRYFDDLHRLCCWWVQGYGAMRAVEFGVLQVREGRERLRKGRGAATVNRYLSALRSAWNWARSAGLLPDDRLFPSRVMLTEPRGRTRALADEELAALLKAAREHSALMQAAVVVSIATGIRQGELLRLDWSDVDWTRQTARIRESKNDEPRTVHLPQSALDALRALKREKIVGAPVFLGYDGARLKKSTLEARWSAVRETAGLKDKDLHWHDLRHSFASALATNGATLLEIGRALGHKSPAATWRYSHLTQGKPVTGQDKLNEKLRQ
jgi:integrase